MNVRFLVTGHGRSGTLWLAKLLNQDKSIACHHEPLAQFDSRHYANVYDDTMDGAKFARQRRKKMKRLTERHVGRDYAEVNSYLRYCVPALRAEFPGVPIAAIVRDGRYVVRSMLARGCYERENYPPIQPPIPLDPFDACAWYWAETYRRLVEDGVLVFRLEDLNVEYKQFHALCKHLGAEVSSEQWARFAGKPTNVGVGVEPLTWDDDRRETFELLAGDVQGFFGYEV